MNSPTTDMKLLLDLAAQFDAVLGQESLPDKDLKEAVSKLYISTIKEKESGQPHLSIHSKWNPMHWFARIFKKKNYTISEESVTAQQLKILHRICNQYSESQIKNWDNYKQITECKRRLDALLSHIEERKIARAEASQRGTLQTFFKTLHLEWKIDAPLPVVQPPLPMLTAQTPEVKEIEEAPPAPPSPVIERKNPVEEKLKSLVQPPLDQKRSAWTYAFSRSPERENIYELHILNDQGEVTSQGVFEVDQEGKLCQAGKVYANVDECIRAFTTEFRKEPIMEYLQSQPVGTFIRDEREEPHVVYIREQDGVKEYVYKEVDIPKTEVIRRWFGWANIEKTLYQRGYEIQNVQYDNIEDFLKTCVADQTIKAGVLPLRSYHSLEAREKQIETIKSLREQFYTRCSQDQLKPESLDNPKTSPFTVADEGSSAAFILTDPLPGQAGDFLLISGLRLAGTPPKPRITNMEPFTVLENGKIKYGGRTFDSFEVATKSWGVGQPLYDTYILESSCTTEQEAISLLKQTPGDCFLLWKTEDNQMRFSVRQNQVIQTHIISKDQESGSVLYDGKLVEGELISFLRSQHAYVPSYGQVKIEANRAALLADLKHEYVDAAAKDDLQRLSNVDTKQQWFTLTEEAADQQFSWKIYEYQEPSIVGRLFTSGKWVVKDAYRVQVRADGKLDVHDNTIHTSQVCTVDEFKTILSSRQSVKRFEIRQAQAAAEREVIEGNIKAILQEARRDSCYAETPEAAQKMLDAHWNILGKESCNQWVITRQPNKDVLLVCYKNEKGKLVTEKFTISMEKKTFAEIKEAVGKPSIADGAPARQKREALFSTLCQTPGYIGNKAEVEKKLKPIQAVVASLGHYALCIDTSKAGIKEAFLCYFNNQNTLQFEPLDMADLENKDSDQLLPSILKSHPELRLVDETELQSKQSAFEAKCKEVVADKRIFHNFVGVNSEFQALKKFFGDRPLNGGWLVRPVALQYRFGMLPITPSSLDRFFISIADPSSEQQVVVDPVTAKFVIGDKQLDSLDQIAEMLGAKRLYSELAEEKRQCEEVESALERGAGFERERERVEAMKKMSVEAYGVSCVRPGVYEVIWKTKNLPIQSAQFTSRDIPGKLTTLQGAPLVSVEAFIKEKTGQVLLPYKQATAAQMPKEEVVTSEPVKSEPVKTESVKTSPPKPTVVAPPPQQTESVKPAEFVKPAKPVKIMFPDLAQLKLSNQTLQVGRRLVCAYHWWTQQNNSNPLDAASARQLLAQILSCTPEEISKRLEEMNVGRLSAKDLGIATKQPAVLKEISNLVGPELKNYPTMTSLQTFFTNLVKWTE